MMFLCFPDASGRDICRRLTTWLDLPAKERSARFRSDTFRWLFVSSLRRVVQIYEVRSLWRVSLLLAALITLPSLFSLCQTNSSRQCVRRVLAHILPALLSAPLRLSERSTAYETYFWLVNLNRWPTLDWNSWYITRTCVHTSARL